MKNVDISRDSFDPSKNFSRVVKQQGRVELDADWNEHSAITLRCLRLMMQDLIGPHAGPKRDCGFSVLLKSSIDENTGADVLALLNKCDAGDFVLSAGRYYVAGVMCEAHRPFRFTRQTLAPAPIERSEQSVHLVYLDVWEREVIALEDGSLGDAALGGIDTAARLQVMTQVRTLAVPRGEPGKPRNTSRADLSPSWADHIDRMQSSHRGALSARARPVIRDDHDTGQRGQDGDPSARGAYRGVENQLYRIEIHRAGAALDKGATFKWARDNGTVVFEVVQYTVAENGGVDLQLAAPGRDDTRQLSRGDVVEFADAPHEDHPIAGLLFEVESLDPASRAVRLKRPPGSPHEAPPATVTGTALHPLILRRWDHASDSPSSVRRELVEGGVPLREDTWLTIEDGIQVRFAVARGKMAHHYRPGDYWLVPGRVATGDVDWPRHGEGPAALAPRGVEHYYAPLALIDVEADATVYVAQLEDRFGYYDPKGLGDSIRVLGLDGDAG